MAINSQNIQVKRFDFFALRDFAGSANVTDENFIENIVVEQPIIEPPAPPTFSAEELEQAKKIAYQQGVNDGKEQAILAQTQIDAQNQAQIARNLEELISYLKQADELVKNHIKQTEEELAKLALAAAHKIASSSLNQNALPLLQEMIANCLPHILHYPTLKITLNESDSSEYWQDINAQISEAEYRGEVQIISNPALERGDIKIEWQFGTFERSIQTINQQLTEISPKLDFPKEINQPKPSTRAALAARAARLNQVKEQ
jgi:flagellar biosynthesis/type III secretory pathway protein FliH